MFVRIVLAIDMLLWGLLIVSGCDLLFIGRAADAGPLGSEKIIFYLVIPLAAFTMAALALIVSWGKRFKPTGCIVGAAAFLLLLPYLMLYTGGM